MHFRLPYSPRKRYLTGIDWVVNTLDSITRKATGHGNSSQVVLVLKGHPDVERLRTLLGAVFAACPVLRGQVRRDWNLCPYWRPGIPAPVNIPLSIESLPDSDFDAALVVLKQHVQRPFRDPAEHLDFKLVNYRSNRSLLGMHFDHRLLDAHGAELFLEMLNHSGVKSTMDSFGQVQLTEPAHLDHWIRRFIGGRNTNRLQVRLSRGGLAALPVSPASPPLSTNFEVVAFSPMQSRKIRAAAERESGPLMIFPALLARVLQALHKLLSARGHAVGHYVIPVSVARRDPDKLWSKLFFNHLSFIIFQVPVEAVEAGDNLTDLIREQLYEQVKNGVPEDIRHASMLTRIAPLALMRLFAKIPMKGGVATSYFSCLKGSGFTSKKFLGSEVENLIHTPHVPPRPGLGVFMNFFGDRMNLVISHIDGLLGDDASKLVADLKKRLQAMQ